MQTGSFFQPKRKDGGQISSDLHYNNSKKQKLKIFFEKNAQI